MLEVHKCFPNRTKTVFSSILYIVAKYCDLGVVLKIYGTTGNVGCSLCFHRFWSFSLERKPSLHNMPLPGDHPFPGSFSLSTNQHSIYINHHCWVTCSWLFGQLPSALLKAFVFAGLQFLSLCSQWATQTDKDNKFHISLNKHCMCPFKIREEKRFQRCIKMIGFFHFLHYYFTSNRHLPFILNAVARVSIKPKKRTHGSNFCHRFQCVREQFKVLLFGYKALCGSRPQKIWQSNLYCTSTLEFSDHLAEGCQLFLENKINIAFSSFHSICFYIFNWYLSNFKRAVPLSFLHGV